MSEGPARQARVERKTKETDVTIHLDVDGTGGAKVATPIPFFSHMLEAWSKHGLMDLAVDASGDVEVDIHHTVEDVGIVLGQTLRKALGDKRGIVRYGTAFVPMDETLVAASVDISAEITLHVTMHYGHNLHHITEAVFKAVGRALADATRLNPRIAGILPSTKGAL